MAEKMIDETISVSVTFDRDAFALLERLSSRTNVSVSEMMRQCLEEKYQISTNIVKRRRLIPFSPSETQFLVRHFGKMRTSTLAQKLSEMSDVERSPATCINKAVELNLVKRKSRAPKNDRVHTSP
jgi:hypothetical protein